MTFNALRGKKYMGSLLFEVTILGWYVHHSEKWGYECLLRWFHKFYHNTQTICRPIGQCSAVQGWEGNWSRLWFLKYHPTLCHSVIYWKVVPRRIHPCKAFWSSAKLRSKINCNIKTCECNDIYSKYMAKKECIRNGESADKMHQGVFDKVTLDIQCTCLLFEFRGIICRHYFVVLTQEEVKSLSPKYVLKRWRKHIRRWHTYIKAS